MTRELKEQTNDLLSYIRKDAQDHILFPSSAIFAFSAVNIFPVEFFFKKSLVTDLLPVVISDWRGPPNSLATSRTYGAFMPAAP
jgi:hypothetical protein